MRGGEERERWEVGRVPAQDKVEEPGWGCVWGGDRVVGFPRRK